MKPFNWSPRTVSCAFLANALLVTDCDCLNGVACNVYLAKTITSIPHMIVNRLKVKQIA